MTSSNNQQPYTYKQVCQDEQMARQGQHNKPNKRRTKQGQTGNTNTHRTQTHEQHTQQHATTQARINGQDDKTAAFKLGRFTHTKLGPIYMTPDISLCGWTAQCQRP